MLSKLETFANWSGNVSLTSDLYAAAIQEAHAAMVTAQPDGWAEGLARAAAKHLDRAFDVELEAQGNALRLRAICGRHAELALRVDRITAQLAPQNPQWEALHQHISWSFMPCRVEDAAACLHAYSEQQARTLSALDELQELYRRGRFSGWREFLRRPCG